MRLGVIGTMVWDTIYARDARGSVTEEWGGISYGLAALAVSLPQDWEVMPILKVGGDLAERANFFLRDLPRLDVESGVRAVPEANNRVELRYDPGERRCERLTGGVPAWTWAELRPLIERCDALYVNFISGFEMELATCTQLRRAFAGPIYADLHSLFLSVSASGWRVARALPAWREWLGSFDIVQMNDDEFDLLGSAWGDPWKLAAEVVGPDLRLIAVTMGARGAAYVAAPSFFAGHPLEWARTRGGIVTETPTRSGRVAVEGGERTGDPTGCGDVWGATFFARLLGGDALEVALAAANRMGARNVEHRGASGLHAFLMSQLATGGEVA
ncbi:MAG: carbohydrate kinase family protein [Gemmatimonadetes bacterium]|nr:carbohydrate kinase family protein [Gemmatimonadota bacterium]